MTDLLLIYTGLYLLNLPTDCLQIAYNPSKGTL